MSTCSANNCDNPVYSHDFCRFHQWLRKDEKYQAYKELKKQGKIPVKSKKRKEDEKRYTEICKELEAELRAQDPKGRIFCFFSGGEIPGQISFHHLRGRGRFLKDKQYLVPSINANHLDYHFLPWDKWINKPWHQEFMARLKEKDIETYEKELRRGEKALPKLNPRLFDDDEELF